MSNTETTTRPQTRAEARDTTALSTRYGQIGIQAVAAAAQFSASRSAERDALSASHIDQRFVESAA